jgi:hypothetical protein
MPKPPTKLTEIPAQTDLQGALIGPPSRPVDKRSETISGGPGFGLAPLPKTLTMLVRSHDEAQRRYGSRVYEFMLRHPYVRSALDLLVYASLANEFQVVPAVKHERGKPAPDDASAELSQEIADLLTYSLNRLETPIIPTMFDLSETALGYGSSLGEIVWEVVETGRWAGKLVPKAVKPKARDAWNFVVDRFMNVKGIIASYPGLLEWQLLPVEKFLIMTWASTGKGGDPRGTSMLDAVAEDWNFAVQLPKERFRFLQRFGSPTPIGKIGNTAVSRPVLNPDGTLAADQRPEVQFLQSLINYRNGQCMVIGSDDDVTLLEPKGNGEAFGLAENDCRRNILQGILLQARATMEAEHGSKADNEGASDVLGNIVRYIRRWICRPIEWTLLYQTVLYNYGPEVAAEHTGRIDGGTIEHQHLAALLTALASVGYSLDPSQFADIDAGIGGGIIPVRDGSVDSSGQVEEGGKGGDAAGGQDAEGGMQKDGGKAAA